MVEPVLPEGVVVIVVRTATLAQAVGGI